MAPANPRSLSGLACTRYKLKNPSRVVIMLQKDPARVICFARAILFFSGSSIDKCFQLYVRKIMWERVSMIMIVERFAVNRPMGTLSIVVSMKVQAQALRQQIIIPVKILFERKIKRMIKPKIIKAEELNTFISRIR